MPTQGIYQLVVYGKGPADQPFVNVMNYVVSENDATIPFKNATDFIAGWRTAMETEYLDILPADCEVHAYTCKRIHPALSNAAMLQSAHAGNIVGTSVCNGVGMDIAFIADGSTLASVGHIYTPAITDDMIDNGVWQATADVPAGNFVTAIKTQITFGTNTANFIIYHKKTHTWDIVTDGALRPKPILLNRRLRPVL